MGWQDAPIVGEKTPAWASAPVVGASPKVKTKPKTSKLGAFVHGAADTGTFGFLDELGAGVDTIFGSTPGTQTVWDGKTSFKDAYKHNLQTNRDILKQDEAEHGGARLAGQLTGALAVPIPGAAVKTIPRMIASGAAGGAAYGIGSGETTDERLSNIAPGAAFGAAGAAVAPLVAKGGRKALDALNPRVKAATLAKSPEAPYVAEFAQDLKTLADGRSKGAPKGRAAFTIKQVNDVIDGYMEQYGNMINRLPIKDSEKTAIRTAIGQKWSISSEKLNDLLEPVTDPVAKEALKQGIRKTQIAYDYTPELPRGGAGRALANIADVGATAGGALAAGPAGALAGSGAGGLVKKVLRGFSADAGEAARVNSAEKLAKKAKLYRYVQDITGPSPQPAADAALRARYGAVVDNPKLGDPIEAIISENVAKGKRGTGEVLANYAARQLGVPVEDAEKALRKLAEVEPRLADDALRLASNYPTKNRKTFGTAANPRLKEILTEDGVYERLKVDGGLDAPVLEGVRKGNQTPLQVDISSPGIRNPEAYRATAQGNQNRVSQTLSSIQGHAALPDSSKALLAEAATTLGSTSSKAEAEATVKAALDALPDDQKALGEIFLKPLLAQIKK